MVDTKDTKAWTPEWTKQSNQGFTYVVVTSRQTWGIGKSLVEAARNADVRQRVEAHIYRIANNSVESVGVSEIDGGVKWTWNKTAMVESALVRINLSAMFKMGQNLIIEKVTKNSVKVSHVEK